MKLNLNNVNLKISAGLANQFPGDPVPQVALAGRSNVGKSSLVNCLLGRKSLARVSGEPGKTITVNFYDVDRKLYLVDLPGYGFAKRTKEEQQKWSSLTDGYFTKNPNADRIMLVVQLIDSRIGPTKDDLDMLSYLSECGIPHAVAATKCDKLNATERKKSEESLRSNPACAGAEEIIFFSSKTREGRDELWNAITAHCNL
ncbi:MAG: YihA family ribosome biogenesis GTP-binding protein [Clostridia bacterium]|nr:YihA family ribosome biogenesis GTP-binding protein [Clostridia bacterium]